MSPLPEACAPSQHQDRHAEAEMGRHVRYSDQGAKVDVSSSRGHVREAEEMCCLATGQLWRLADSCITVSLSASRSYYSRYCRAIRTLPVSEGTPSCQKLGTSLQKT